MNASNKSASTSRKGKRPVKNPPGKMAGANPSRALDQALSTLSRVGEALSRGAAGPSPAKTSQASPPSTAPQGAKGGGKLVKSAVGGTKVARFVDHRDGPHAGAHLDGTIGIAHSTIIHGDRSHFREIEPSLKSIPGYAGVAVVEYTGRELWNTWFVDNGANTQMCSVAQLNPVTMLGTRMQLEARNWQYYRFKELKVHFISSLPTTQAGQAAMLYLSDPNTSYLSKTGNTMLRRIMSLPETTVFNVWQHCTMHVNWADDCPLLRTNPGDELRTSTQGTLGFALTSNPGLGTPASPSSIGQIMLEYKIEFCEPILDTNETTVELVAQSFTYPVAAPSTAVTATINLANWNSNFPNTRVYAVTIQNGGSTLIPVIPQSQYAQNEASAYIFLSAGATVYAITSGANVVTLFATVDAAFGGGDPLVWAFPASGTPTASLVRVVPAVVDYN